MTIKSIKVGSWYRTKAGIGKVLDTKGYFPPAVRMNIVFPFPRGVCMVPPRDVQEETVAPTEGEGTPKEWQ